MSYFTRHLDEVGETYWQHFRHAISFAWWMLVGMFCCSVHALCPFFFEKTGSSIISRLHDRMVVNRQNLTQNKS